MASSLDSEIQQLTKQIQTLVTKVQDNDEARTKLLNICQGLGAQLKTPVEKVWEMMFHPTAPAVLLTLIEMGAIDKLNATQGSISAADLAESCRAEELLVVRLIRPLIPLGFVKEEGEYLYSSTPLSKSFEDPALRGGFVFMNGCQTAVMVAMPEYFKKQGYKNIAAHPGVFQYTHKTDLPTFAWLMDHPYLMSHFNVFMSSSRVGRPDWFTLFPMDKILFQGLKPDLPVLVDVGGGKGHDIQAFHKAYPNHPGKLVLQDLPPVIAEIKDLDSAIERQPHDFFTRQPVQGARAYYFRQIFHDHGDEACLQILANIKQAMKPGYSKVLCNEFCLPDKDVPLYPTLLDLNMLTLLGGMERTKKQWCSLMDRAGFKIIEIYLDPTGSGESLIEAELV